MVKIGRYTIDDQGNLLYDRRVIIPKGDMFKKDWTFEFTKATPMADFKDYLKAYKLLRSMYYETTTTP
jgi:hypothetical protein